MSKYAEICFTVGKSSMFHLLIRVLLDPDFLTLILLCLVCSLLVHHVGLHGILLDSLHGLWSFVLGTLENISLIFRMLQYAMKSK